MAISSLVFSRLLSPLLCARSLHLARCRGPLPLAPAGGASPCETGWLFGPRTFDRAPAALCGRTIEGRTLKQALVSRARRRRSQVCSLHVECQPVQKAL